MKPELKAAIAEVLEVEPSDLDINTVLNEIDTWDSVIALTIMIMLGEEIGIPILPNEMKNLETFGDIEELVIKKIKFLEGLNENVNT
ncbi:MAG: acyl carrier protein [Bacillota bacterium]